ncbi:MULTISPECIES: hypothetical protein [unclassified Polaribacter]|uniref:hypothetical protein n=1 Tax=unclassified Polaribacter TaxID=196858 RepID=UPI0011BEA6D2|nr:MULTISPECIES: hypothetical protein [unclassified Polaribacter]TXD50579.1 hypothetical protein ES043_15405 [Polaribacter sp. IC063]TXD61732.1 hypothetical protein ES044_04400 [Polaribacter sp. IC066]
MKTLKLLLIIAITGTLFSSCSSVYNDSLDTYQPTLENVVSGYDIWYVDYHRTVGDGDIPYVSRAFTLSFINGILYANNNIVDIGRTGNGLGIDVGTYNAFNGLLETNHDRDGAHDFEVTVLSENEIRLYNFRQNVSYYLIGYNTNNFDYDQLFYENIEYFLQEYRAWGKIETVGGTPNAFDEENYLQFTLDNITTFYSSQDNFGTQVDSIQWDYEGAYEIFDVAGYEDLKILTLNYDNGDNEEFELSVINDGRVRLYHIKSDTTYDFSGKIFIQLLKSEKTVKSAKDLVRNNNRKRTKIERKTKIRRNLK